MKTLLVYLLMVFPMILWAVDDARILMVRGTVSVQQHGRKIAASSGSQLATSAVVEIGPSGYIAILRSGAGVVELTSPGTYKVDAAFAGLKRTSTAKRVASYLYANAFGNQTKGSETGTVYRSQTISATWPPNTIVDTSVLTVRWRAPRNYSGAYILRVMTDSDSLLKVIPTTDTLMVLDLQSFSKSYRGTCLYWTVVAAIDSTIASSPRCIHWATDDELRMVSAQAAELLSVSTIESASQISPLQGVLLGSLYEEQGYYDRALHYYSKGQAGVDLPQITSLYQSCVQRGHE